MIKQQGLKGLLVLLFLTLLACEQDSNTEPQSQGTKPSPPVNDARWSEYIQAHTSGHISKLDPITIRFSKDVAKEPQSSATSALSTQPSIPGRILFNSKREIVLQPEHSLRSGQVYRFRIHAKALHGVPEDLEDYVFDAQVIKQDFEIIVQGINAEIGTEGMLQVSGQLNTADREANTDIEQLLQATHQDKVMNIQWQHTANGRSHVFYIHNVPRSEQNTTLSLVWDGKPIAVGQRGKRDIDIPALGKFEVANVRVADGDRQYIEIQFSDILNPSQNLDGLVRLGEHAFTAQVEGNVLKVFPTAALKGEFRVELEPSIQNHKGVRLGKAAQHDIVFTSRNPEVRFAGKGVILPNNQVLSIPFEALNVNSVQISAMLVYENNIGQFLQDNKLDGDTNIHRVGRYLWRKTIKLKDPKPDRWNRYALDATELLQRHPGGLFRLTLSINRGNSTYPCPTERSAEPVQAEPPILNHEEADLSQASNWDYFEEFYNEDNDVSWEEREDPCENAYYLHAEKAKDSRNFMASNLGLLAKRGAGDRVYVVATELSTAAPLADAQIELRNFQNQPLGQATTDAQGFAELDPKGRAFYLIARKDGQVGYLKLSAGNALPTSHFDVGGEKIKQGIKGFIYGERGVWRPGDDVHLTFVLEDKADALPDDHPVTMQLYNPKGQLIDSLTNAQGVGGFYTFKFTTSEDALTGNWRVKALLGGSIFTKTVKIETVTPNRLKIDLKFPGEALYQKDMPARIELFSQWLHGAKAGGLRGEVKVRPLPVTTRFGRFNDYQFDDLARSFRAEPVVLFDNKLDQAGKATFSAKLQPSTAPPGMLSASFTTRVYENGGAFSTHNTRVTYHPYEHYVGLRLPKGDQARDMLLTDTKHTVEIASLNAKGEPASLGKVKVSLYKLDWKWWWDQSGDSLAQYASANYNAHLQQDFITTKDGQGRWSFQINYPEWGRFLVRACDSSGGHCSSKIFYIDWPAWAGAAREQRGVGASVLSLSADKPRYQVGESAQIKLPKANQGLALVSVETGSQVLSRRWVKTGPEQTVIDVPLTRQMSPNAYVAVSLIQPHAGKDNDRPIRLYGVIPLLVDDPATKLSPIVNVAQEWRPASEVSVEVKEAHGRPMTYTLAIVDEGLLGLTNFKTPNLHKHFYKKEALGVQTWDLFDEVTGAYGGELERLLALGGDGDAGLNGQDKKRRRFPPIVQFLGPFKLPAGATEVHKYQVPQYLGAVRVMVVAGHDGAYGLAKQSVFVRQPLGLLATLPRVVGPGETLRVPVSLFVTDEKIKNVQLALETNDHFTIQGQATTQLSFQEPGEQIGFITLRVAGRLGKGRLKFTASSGEHRTQSEVYIDVRAPNAASSRQLTQAIEPGAQWTSRVQPHGLPGTNKVTLEVSTLPSVSLQSRLQYLVRYPHGCLEQTTSASFPQLYLPKILNLSPAEKAKIQKHMEAAVAKLRQYQQAQGGFSYWPGSNAYNSWSNNYVGHFLLEAKRLGYYVPEPMLSAWIKHQKSAANSWAAGGEQSELDQAYRLYTLALANQPELGAMNRLQQHPALENIARWMLANAYHLIGLSDVAADLVDKAGTQAQNYKPSDASFGSALRDQAIVLMSLAATDDWEKARPIAEHISQALASQQWYSTQEVAFSLMATARYAGQNTAGTAMRFKLALGDRAVQDVDSGQPIYLQTLEGVPDQGQGLTLTNTSKRVLHATVTTNGIPQAGTEREQFKGLGLWVHYTDTKGAEVDVSKLVQNTDVIAHIRILNRSGHKLDNLALTHMIPSGWQIDNPRMAGDNNAQAAAIDYQDIRDDRIYTYFGLQNGEEKRFKVLLNASFLGRYYQPGISVEAMYDASKNARSPGQWVEVVQR